MQEYSYESDIIARTIIPLIHYNVTLKIKFVQSIAISL